MSSTVQPEKHNLPNQNVLKKKKVVLAELHFFLIYIFRVDFEILHYPRPGQKQRDQIQKM